MPVHNAGTTALFEEIAGRLAQDGVPKTPARAP